MKYYIIAGEASGDLHGANLMRALRQEDPDASFRVWGGEHMEDAGGEVIKHYRDLAFMGFVEVAKNLRTILRNIAFCKADIEACRPDVLILIDYPGFNLRIAEWAHPLGYQVVYYISPQVWAWKESRVKKIKANVDQLYVILPFEQDFYARHNYPVTFEGHPLLDVIENYPVPPKFRQEENLGSEPIVALLPGSRRQEISRMLSVMLTAVPRFPNLQFVIAGAPSIEPEFYRSFVEQSPDPSRVHLVSNRTYDLLCHAHAALVTSGTATLETALFGVPEVVCYKGNALSYWIARRLVDVPFISLVNLVVERELVRELIQNQLTPNHLAQALHQILDPEHRRQLALGYADLRARLGESGASNRVAHHLVNRFGKK